MPRDRIKSSSVAVGSATARTIAYKPRDDDFFYYPGKSSWRYAFVGGSYQFERDGARLLDPRTFFFFEGTFVTPAMAAKLPAGVGSQYAFTVLDANGRPFDGAKTYRLHLPAGIPARAFWSVVLYDTQTRSMLQTGQQFPSTGSQNPALQTNPDGSCDPYFAPAPPAGQDSNWVQTWPGKGWLIILRLYAPEQAWFDKTWRPGEITLVP